MMTLVPMERSDTPVARLRNFFLLATAFIGTTALSGCAHIDTRKSGQIDLAERTMTVPANRFGFDARLDKALLRHGWKLGGVQTRYTLMTSWSWDGYCVEDCCPIYKFNISIIDNRTGGMVLKISGRHSLEAIVPAFNKVLQNGA